MFLTDLNPDRSLRFAEGRGFSLFDYLIRRGVPQGDYTFTRSGSVFAGGVEFGENEYVTFDGVGVHHGVVTSSQPTYDVSPLDRPEGLSYGLFSPESPNAGTFVTSFLSFPNAPFSLSFDIKTTANSAAAQEVISSSAGPSVWRTELVNGYVRLRIANSFDQIRTPGTINDGEFHTVVFSINPGGSGNFVAVDGVVTPVAYTTGTWAATSGTATMGGTYSENLDAGIKDLVYYNRQVTEAEAANLSSVPNSAKYVEYAFNDGSGTTVTDSSGNDNNGTIVNITPGFWVTDPGAPYVTAASNAAGTHGLRWDSSAGTDLRRALVGPAVLSYGLFSPDSPAAGTFVTSNLSFPNAPFSLSFGIKTTANTATAQEIMSSSAGPSVWRTELVNGYVRLRIANSFDQIRTPGTINDGEFHTVVFSINPGGSGNFVAVDGVVTPVAYTTGTWAPVTGTGTIGGTYSSNLDAGIKDLIYYNRQVTAAETANLSSVPNSAKYVEYAFNDGSGTTVTDSSGNNSDGTIVNITPGFWVTVSGVSGTIVFNNLLIRPELAQKRTSGNINLLNEFFYINGTTGVFTLTDGTNTATSPAAYTPGVAQDIEISWGNSEMVIVVDGVPGSRVPFAGTLLPGGDNTLRFAQGNEDIATVVDVFLRPYRPGVSMNRFLTLGTEILTLNNKGISLP